MTTQKYDLHEIEYSVQGWDDIMNTDMQKLDAVVPTREIVTLGETVATFEALYQKASDSKWYKAQADGTKQPCMGLALESGVNNDQIRIHRMGLIQNTSWNWVTIGAPIYLSPSTAGALTQTKPDTNVQIIGYAYAANRLIAVMEGVRSNAAQFFSRGGTLVYPTEAINIIVWRAPFACTVRAVKGYRVDGTGATVNARRNGVSNHLASHLSLTSANEWMDGGTVQNTAYVAGDRLEIMIVSITGSPTQVAVQVDFAIV